MDKDSNEPAARDTGRSKHETLWPTTIWEWALILAMFGVAAWAFLS